MKFSKAFFSILGVAAVVTVGAQAFAGGSAQELLAMKKDCNRIGTFASLGYTANQKHENAGVLIKRLKETGSLSEIGTTWNELELTAINYGRYQATNEQDAAEYGFAKCLDNWARANRDEHFGTQTRSFNLN